MAAHEVLEIETFDRLDQRQFVLRGDVAAERHAAHGDPVGREQHVGPIHEPDDRVVVGVRGWPRQDLDALAAERDGDAIGIREIRRHDEREWAACDFGSTQARRRDSRVIQRELGLDVALRLALLDAAVAVRVLRADVLRRCIAGGIASRFIIAS